MVIVEFKLRKEINKYTCKPMCTLSVLYAGVRTYIRTYIQTYIHTYLHIHTYIHLFKSVHRIRTLSNFQITVLSVSVADADL